MHLQNHFTFFKKYIRIFLARPYIPDQMIKVLPNG